MQLLSEKSKASERLTCIFSSPFFKSYQILLEFNSLEVYWAPTMLMKGGSFSNHFSREMSVESRTVQTTLESCLSLICDCRDIQAERCVWQSASFSSSSTAVALRIYVSLRVGSPRALDSRYGQSVCCYPDHSACGVIITDAGVMSICWVFTALETLCSEFLNQGSV